MAYDIRERDLGGILDEAIILFRDQFKFVAALVLFILAPANLVLNIASESFSQTMAPLNAGNVSSDTEAMRVLASFGLNFSAFILLVLFVSLVVGSLVEGTLLYGIANRYLGNRATVLESLKVGLRRLPAMAAGNFIMGIAGTVGMCFCILPGLLIMAMFYVFPAVLVLEGSGPIESLGRSWRLIQHYLWQTVALILVMVLIGAGTGALAAIVPSQFVIIVLTSIIEGFFNTFTHIAMLSLYFSVRCRSESLDLDLLVNAVDVPGALPEAQL